MIKRSSPSKFALFFIIVPMLFVSGCSIIRPSKSVKRAVLLKTEVATQDELFEQINNFGRVDSMYAKMYLKFEDNSYAEVGLAERFKTVDAVMVVQRPGNIQMKVQVPIIKTDLVEMTSNGEKFCIAILQDGGDGKYRKFVCGTNSADYSPLEEEVKNLEVDKSGKVLKQNVNAFASLRPQHFTDAMLMRPVDKENYTYLKSTVTQEEIELDEKNKRPKSWFLRGYYLLEEFHNNDDGTLKISRRFWFDRVDTVRLARQQIFDCMGEIEADIIYGKLGNLTESGVYNNLPLEIELTRPKEKYKMRLTYQNPELVSIGKTYPQEAFELENEKNLPEVDLDNKLREVLGQSSVAGSNGETQCD